MTPVRLGAVGYLNARPLVFGLDGSARFAIRYDVPSECARLLHAGEIDVGLIPSIEYLRDSSYRIVPGLAITSSGPVASVALFTKRPVSEVRSIAMDTSSRTSVALVRTLCARVFKIDPSFEPCAPDLEGMLARADAALVIGDVALLADPASVRITPDPGQALASGVQKIDLGETWTAMTGLPFVWAAWVGRDGALSVDDVDALKAARDVGVGESDVIARDYFPDSPDHRRLAARYLRDNIKYYLGRREQAGLELFYRYAVEVGAAPGDDRVLEFFEAGPLEPVTPNVT
jgi:chorismate dehydratase